MHAKRYVGVAALVLFTLWLIACDMRTPKADTPAVSMLATLVPEGDLVRQQDRDGVLISGPGRLQSTDHLVVPLQITALVKTRGPSVRLYFGEKGMVALQWEGAPGGLQYHDPLLDQRISARDAGHLLPDPWHEVRWIIDEHVSRVVVNGQDRAVFPGSYSGLSGRVGIGTQGQDGVTIRAFDAGPPSMEDLASTPVAPVDGPVVKPPASSSHTLVLWNTHHSELRNRGARSCNVRLYLGEREVAVLPQIELAWDRAAAAPTRVFLPPGRFDRVRVELTRHWGVGAGLTEIEVLRGNTNLALRARARASAEYEKEFPAARVTDGIKDNRGLRGYWLLPNAQPGWIEVVLNEPMEVTTGTGQGAATAASAAVPAQVSTPPAVPRAGARAQPPARAAPPAPDGIDASGDAPAAATPDGAAEVTTLALPSTVEGVAVGGGGRYLLLHLRKLRKLAVFDAEEAIISGYVSLPSDEVLFAAGAQKLFVLSQSQNMLQRYDLASLERELSVVVPGGQTPRIMLMGWASAGPLILVTENGTRFHDPATLRELPIEAKSGPTSGDAHRSGVSRRLWVSADGTAIGGRNEDSSPSGVYLWQRRGNELSLRHEHTSAGYVIPNFDGSLVLTQHGVWSEQLKPLARDRFQGLWMLPAHSPNYILGLRPHDSGPKRAAELTVYAAGDRNALFKLDGLRELDGLHDRGRADLPIEQRLNVMPPYGLIVTVPIENDRLVMRRFELLDALERAGVDYLFVDSIPPRAAQRGRTYEYQVQVRSRRGGVQTLLDSGPEGMSVSPAGKLTWPVPRDFNEPEIGVILRVTDASGQEVFHAFTISLPGTETTAPGQRGGSSPMPR